MAKYIFFGGNSSSVIMSGSGKTIINGVVYDTPKGASISVNNGRVIINGKDVTNEHSDAKEINITIQGDVAKAKVDNNLIINGNVVNAEAGNNIAVEGNIEGRCSAGNNIKADIINGNCSAGNNIYK